MSLERSFDDLAPLGRVTLSGGVATFPEDAKTEDSLIASADARLYAAKESGRNPIVAEGPETSAGGAQEARSEPVT